MATLNGEDIFGPCVVRTEILPVAIQRTSFPGVHGVAELRMGSRGRVTRVQGYLVGATPSDVALAESNARSYQYAGQAWDFVDNQGTTWSNVRLDSFAPVERITPASMYGLPYGYCLAYSAVLIHLT